MEKKKINWLLILQGWAMLWVLVEKLKWKPFQICLGLK